MSEFEAHGPPTWDTLDAIVRRYGLACPIPECDHDHCKLIRRTRHEVIKRESEAAYRAGNLMLPFERGGTLHIEGVDVDYLMELYALVKDEEATTNRFAIEIRNVAWHPKPRPSWWHPIERLRWNLADPDSKRRGDFVQRAFYLDDFTLERDGAGYKFKL